eukprot:scaffold2911_cov414-Prasinococcus_capsulatus_cf.AAC.50
MRRSTPLHAAPTSTPMTRAVPRRAPSSSPDEGWIAAPAAGVWLPWSRSLPGLRPILRPIGKRSSSGHGCPHPRAISAPSAGGLGGVGAGRFVQAFKRGRTSANN